MLSLERICEELSDFEQRVGIANFDQASFEQNAATLRNALCDLGLDPADEDVVSAGLVASYMNVGYLSNSLVIGPAVMLAVVQCDIFKRWKTNELPRLSLAEHLELQAMEALTAPCEYVHTWPSGLGQTTCTQLRGHAGDHVCQEIENGCIVERHVPQTEA